MTLILWRSYTKARNNVLCANNSCNSVSSLYNFITRSLSDDKFSSPEFSNSTILIENGFNVHELPVVVRKLKDIEALDEAPVEIPRPTNDSFNYHLIQEEFKQCMDLRDVFSLITKCTKITPNIALGAIERIYDLEKSPHLDNMSNDQTVHINFAKGAILEKLLKVVMKTEDTQTILNVLKTSSTVMEPHKYKFCDELLIRVIDNKLTVEQLCDFAMFLNRHSSDQKYSDTIDRLWVGFIDKEKDINEINIVQIFSILPGLKVSKKTLTALLEQKLSELWSKIKVTAMQDILDIFLVEKYFSVQSYGILGHWFYSNIHALDDDELLGVITKFTRLKFTDKQIDAAIAKFLKFKSSKIRSQVLVIGILNYCMQFKLRNEQILEICSQYFIAKRKNVPSSFLKSFIYPYGYLYMEPSNIEFWTLVEEVLLENYLRISIDDLCSIISSYIYCGHYPLKLVSKIFSAEYMAKINNCDILKKLHLIDTALSLECEEYSGPLLPKDQWFKPVMQDSRIKNIIEKTKGSFVSVIGGANKMSTAVVLPNYCSDETYLIDVLIHPADTSSSTFNWKCNTLKNESIAILIHLPDHYCSDNKQLIGPQVMKKRHLNILGLKVVSLKYTLLSQFYTSYNTTALKKYLSDSIDNAEPSL
ncbi:FAST kinase domain-containing protein 2, mitochondrial-like [Maniola jurtina]|uniref:FAST kinase domain-containing protein 2, mitochondrial-like n=1 Tax=Maniola jurtina TaxID=191418 RepID=UPI001E688E11|nr:FAST kinase domain-containing protein 2, mitochondrial-like [Maniola jurtina]